MGMALILISYNNFKRYFVYHIFLIIIIHSDVITCIIKLIVHCHVGKVV